MSSRIFEKGILLEDLGVTLHWGKTFEEIASLLKIKATKGEKNLKIGNHILLKGLPMADLIVGNTGYKDMFFNTIYGKVQSEALDHLSEKFDINLQPSLPNSTSEGDVDMKWQQGSVVIWYTTINVRGEGSFQNLLGIDFIKKT